MGQIGGTFATQLAIDKAAQYGVATATLRNCGHVGRVGAYPLQVARQGMIGLAFCNAGHPRAADRSLRRDRRQAQHQPHILRRTSAQRRPDLSRYDHLGLRRGQGPRRL